MKPAPFDYLPPESIGDAVAALANMVARQDPRQRPKPNSNAGISNRSLPPPFGASEVSILE